VPELQDFSMLGFHKNVAALDPAPAPTPILLLLKLLRQKSSKCAYRQS
jgi:hypothetical protein